MTREFKVSTDGMDLTAAEMRNLVVWALQVEAGRRLYQGKIEAIVEDARAPRVIIQVEGGMADVRAVDGAADIVIVDLDLEGQLLDNEDVDNKMSLIRSEGTRDDFDAAMDQVRSKLETFVDEDESPAP